MSVKTQIERLAKAAAEIKTAIEEKGVSVPAGAKLDDIPALIRCIAVPMYEITYMDDTGTKILYSEIIQNGKSASDPVEDGDITKPIKDNTTQYSYSFSGWSLSPGGSADTNALKDVIANRTVYAAYTATPIYYVYYYNGSTLLYTDRLLGSGQTSSYHGSTPTKAQDAQYTYSFAGWALTDGGAVNSNALKNITATRSVFAAYSTTIRKYTVYFYNGSNLLQTVQNIPYGGSATYTGETPVDPSGDGGEFEGWSPTPYDIKGNTSCYAQFASMVEVAEISDSWEKILASIEAGTYKTKYKVGNYKPISLGSEGTVNMQIAGFDKDTLADGRGTAAITWISKELLATSKHMNPAREGDSGNYTEGTGSIGGWEKCEMRTYMKGTIKPLIPETVRNAIKNVTKEQPAYNSAGSSFTQTTTDDVWLPAYNEMFGSSRPYKSLFPDNASRVKCKAGTTSASWWWLRSAYSTGIFDNVYSGGYNSCNHANNTGGVVLGFCT